MFPVPQAYSAYTPFLDEKDARFLEDDAVAPQRILFDWTAIDGRHPLLDVPALGLAMLRWYGVQGEYGGGGHLVLERRKTPRFGQLRKLRTERFKVGQPLAIDVTRPLVAKIRVRWNWRGDLTKFAYKLPELRT